MIPTYQLSQISGRFNNFEIRIVKDSYAREAIHTAHRHTYFSVILHLKGYANHVIDFNTYTLTQASLVCITPDQVHLPVHSKDFEAVVVSFIPGFPLHHTLFPELGNSPGILVPDDSELAMLKLLTSVMLLEYQKDNPDERMLKNSLDSFIILINGITEKQAAPSGNSAAYQLALRYKALVNKHFISQKNVSFYADLLHVTANHLNDAVKRITHKTAKEMITDRLLTEAKRLLYFEDLSVKEIGGLLRFNEINYFNSFFKKCTSQTPLNYRNEIRKKYS